MTVSHEPLFLISLDEAQKQNVSELTLWIDAPQYVYQEGTFYIFSFSTCH